LLVGTCNLRGEPDCVRAGGVRVWDGACRLTVIVPAQTGAVSIANLRENPRIAMTATNLPTHRSIQIKGSVIAVREGGDEERALATDYRARFCTDLSWAGLPQQTAMRLRVWPCFAVDVEIAVVFSQTPGPVAGHKMPLPEAR
jgi:hypothetical protein